MKNSKYFLISAVSVLFIGVIFILEKPLVSAQLGACVNICTSADDGKCCIAGTGETGTCGYDPSTEGYQCVTNPDLQTHKECRNGACVVVPGPGVNLCQRDAACQQKVCEGQKCVLKLAPGPAGLGPNQCETDAKCTYSPPPTGPRDPKEGEPRPTSVQPREPAGGTGVSIPNPIGADTFQKLVERIARYLFEIGIPIAVIMILYAAFLYMTAGGSEEKITKAHKALTYAIVGLGILFLAWGITSLVEELLGG